jgi:lysophospholipase L1-like esterase
MDCFVIPTEKKPATTAWVLFAFLFLNFTSLAQPKLKEIPALPCMATTISSITYPNGDTTAYYAFFKKMDKLFFEGEGNITILHIGGSHIQAGTFSHQHRSNWLETFPGIIGNRGMLFPFSAAKTNNPYNYRTTYTGEWEMSKNTHANPQFALGLSGMCIATKDPLACIEIQMRNAENLFFDFNTIYILGHCDSGWVTPIIQIDDSVNVEGVYDSARWAYRFHLEKYVDAFRLSFSMNDTLWEPFYLRGFWVENQLPGLTYVDIGVNGASVPSYLKCRYLENDLLFVKPDLCIFSIGINDASGSNFDTALFQQNYKELISRVKSVAPDCAILFTTNNDSYLKSRRTYYNNTNGLLAQQSFLSLGKYYNTGIWDLFSFMGGLGSMKKWEQEGLAKKDKVHFTPQGYRLLGDLLYNALLTEYIIYLQQQAK